ncbi:MAG TPA: zf-HC2 domain-containing protein [Acidimicrobiales bacterium]
MNVHQHPGELLTAYLDGELTPGEAGQVEAHVDRCDACRAELDGLAAARRLVRDLPPVPAPPGFTDGLIAARRRWTRRGGGLALAAAAVALFAGVALADPPGGSDPRQGDRPLSLTGDTPRLEVPSGRPPTADGSTAPTGSPAPSAGAPTTATSAPAPGAPPAEPSATTPTTTPAGPGRDTGSDEASDPVSVGDRIDEIATSLLELIGG